MLRSTSTIYPTQKNRSDRSTTLRGRTPRIVRLIHEQMNRHHELEPLNHHNVNEPPPPNKSLSIGERRNITTLAHRIILQPRLTTTLEHYHHRNNVRQSRKQTRHAIQLVRRIGNIGRSRTHTHTPLVIRSRLRYYSVLCISCVSHYVCLYFRAYRGHVGASCDPASSLT